MVSKIDYDKVKFQNVINDVIRLCHRKYVIKMTSQKISIFKLSLSKILVTLLGWGSSLSSYKSYCLFDEHRSERRAQVFLTSTTSTGAQSEHRTWLGLKKQNGILFFSLSN